MLKDLAFILRISAAYLFLCIGCFLMLAIIIGYGAFRDDVQFLVLKKDYLSNPVWKAAFYIHVFTAIIALFAGFTQFSKTWMKDHRTLHRRIGKLYVGTILLVNTPTGLILAIYANGGLPGKAAFILLDIAWFYFTYRGFACALKSDFIAHRAYMIRSYALTLSAITLRAWKVILMTGFTIDPVYRYIIEAWAGFIPNMIIAEIIIYYMARKEAQHQRP